METSLYNFAAINIKGDLINLDEYKGKVVLIVNTASKCGLSPQLRELENLFQKYKDQDFVILGFPCGQFANQELDEEFLIEEACTMNYGVTFPMFSKTLVIGKNTHVLFRWLKNELRGVLFREIKWNFTKFLIDTNGNPVKRFSPFDSPKKIDDYLKKHYFNAK